MTIHTGNITKSIESHYPLLHKQILQLFLLILLQMF